MESLIHQQESAPDPDWQQISPLLDDGLAQLDEKDRNAVTLRFFEQRAMGEVGLALGLSSDAAQKRVGRAVEKLRRFFQKRGVVLSTAVIGTGISAHAVHAAPLSTATTTTTAALGSTATAATTPPLVQATLKLMSWVKLKNRHPRHRTRPHGHLVCRRSVALHLHPARRFSSPHRRRVGRRALPQGDRRHADKNQNRLQDHWHARPISCKRRFN